jgi:DNA-binding NarL/FixJ family response regulator
MIRTLLADDHNLVRQGIRALLEKMPDIEVVGEAADGVEALELNEKLRPDVIVMDITMPRLNGIQATRRISESHPEAKVIILSVHSDSALIRQALRNGAKGYLLKTASFEELLLAIRAAVRGEAYLSSAVSRVVIERFLDYPELENGLDEIEKLSGREIQVLQLIAEGHTNNSIARELGITVKTVEKHRANLMAKLNVHDLAGVVRTAVKFKLIVLE